MTTKLNKDQIRELIITKEILQKNRIVIDVNEKVQQAMNSKLAKYDLQVSIDPDIKQATDNPNVLGYYIPLNQFKNLIIKALKGE